MIATFLFIGALAAVASAKSAAVKPVADTCRLRNFPLASEIQGHPRELSHSVGIVQAAAPAYIVGPESGAAATGPNTWTVEIPHPLPDTKYVILHFEGVTLPGNNKIEVHLGYDTDVFLALDVGCSFWTRPINVKALGGAPIVVRYISDGTSAGGIATVDKIATGLRQHGIRDPSAYSNCDPFFSGAYVEGTYDPFWFCTNPPHWENAACVADASDPRSRAGAGQSVGMIVMPEGEGASVVSSCTVTLIAPDQVLTAGHCFDSNEDALKASVVFGYESDCAGNAPPGYRPIFYKVEEVMCRRWQQGSYDYAVLRLAWAVVGVDAADVRTTALAAGEPVFAIHHPNGAVKKLSPPHPAYAGVVSPGPDWITVPQSVHVTGGSSGSALFDQQGRVVGVLSDGAPCSGFLLRYYPAWKIPFATCKATFPPPKPCSPGPGPGPGNNGTCPLCNPHPGAPDQCDPSAPCSSTPYGTMCGCRPGFKADGGDGVGMRLNWPVGGHEHRVYVPPGTTCNRLCNEWYLGGEGCKEVPVRTCK